ncbi:transmembrane anterior posterior transformation protein 1 homolog isoform X1 [Pseudochaenichthys georgianus]|uniref:transmembrane anterior posterior transformation protein 1 homolog isoform X1 n=1 Tax=Pseudochaenichthys georgianus TaxID=52239 RepID=UPI00146B98DF|nr:transmembrane anterior posterior transformation protein 1 homolog isoform X1 [Pseudochaenichthys georgianus]
MADVSGSKLSEEKEAEIERKKRQKRPWDELHKSGKIGITPDLPETLGFFDISAVRRREQREAADPSLTRFISAELTRGYFLEHNEAKYTERRERVYTCMRIPKELEKLMTFGFFLCVDAFLYVFTLLPLRVLLAVLRLLTLPCCGFRARTCPYCRRSSGSRLLQPAQVCDVLKGLIMVLCFSMMHYVDYSMMYHLIRGQSVIKLYIIYNMLEVADRLFSSFGQDILDALYWTATEPKERKRDSIGVIPHFFMAVFYVFLHAILIMVQASTLNVAFNSHNKSLLTIMMSNNFVEIKGSVFKKFEKNNLFQMSNSDIKERFTSYVLLLIVCLRNMEQFAWNPDHLWVLFPDVFMVVTSEVAVDIIKHAFITKFNDITADVYSEYRASLAFDLVSSRQKNACTDYSDSVARRMGFIPLPLAVLLIRVVMSSVKVQGALSYTCVFLCYLGLVTLKVLNSIVLLGKSCVYVKRANMEDKLFETPAPPPPSSTSSSKTPSRAEASCPTPPGESKMEPAPVTLCSPPPSSSCSVTTQPSPRTDLFPPQPADHSPAATPPRPPTPTPEPEPPAPPLSKEEEEGEGEAAAAATELKHRTPNKDLLEIDRFTICGNRID